MRILITGGTGFIGRALSSRLLAEGHQLTVLSRHPGTVATRLGAEVTAWRSLDEWPETATFDAVINLAGAPIIDAAWTASRRQVLWDSRIRLTETLVAKMQAAIQPPKVLISGSAIGYYGNTGDQVLNEHSPAGQDFGADLCAAWEQAALTAESPETRVCVLRTGLVLHSSGGMLGRMLWPFRLGLGGPIGDGQQWMGWIHLDDETGIIAYLLDRPESRGIYNLTAPVPVTNQEFTQALAAAVRRPAVFRVPAVLLRWMLGERAELLLGGQKVRPERILAEGYEFVYPELCQALNGCKQN